MWITRSLIIYIHYCVSKLVKIAICFTPSAEGRIFILCWFLILSTIDKAWLSKVYFSIPLWWKACANSAIDILRWVFVLIKTSFLEVMRKKLFKLSFSYSITCTGSCRCSSSCSNNSKLYFMYSYLIHLIDCTKKLI